jgi:type VI secretion system secreted protein Hcp
MAVDMFLNLGANIKGEAQDKDHAETIDVLAWSWGMSQSGTTHMGSGGGAGKVNVQDLSITKYIDSSSAALLKHCAQGIHIPEAVLIIRKAGEKPLEYIKIKMTDVLVSNISTGGSGGEDRLTENVTLNFSKYKYLYTPQKQDGTGGPGKESGFNIAKNTEE